MKFKAKIIRSKGASFIARMSFYLKRGSIKVHFILSDDNDEPHSHPWDFKSFLIFPYKETLVVPVVQKVENKKVTLGTTRILLRHKMFSVIKRKHNAKHKVSLYRFLGVTVPAITIGYYSNKVQLCSFCQELGYCKENPGAKVSFPKTLQNEIS